MLRALTHCPTPPRGCCSARVLRRLPTPRALCTKAAEFSRYESGLQFRDTHVPETGRIAEDGDLLSLHYTGRLEDGTVFDTSLDDSLKGNQPEFEGIPSEQLLGWDRGHPLQFTLGNQEVIAGWDQGVHGMRVGGRRELIVPPELGYGEASRPPLVIRTWGADACACCVGPVPLSHASIGTPLDPGGRGRDDPAQRNAAL